MINRGKRSKQEKKEKKIIKKTEQKAQAENVRQVIASRGRKKKCHTATLLVTA